MPEAGSATITVYDVAGKVAAQRVVNAVKGMNTEKFTRADINASGVLMYKVESGDHVGTKKMIIISPPSLSLIAFDWAMRHCSPHHDLGALMTIFITKLQRTKT